jgi:hypothetical protein
VVVIAALNLVLDFDFIESGVEAGALQTCFRNTEVGRENGCPDAITRLLPSDGTA